MHLGQQEVHGAGPAFVQAVELVNQDRVDILFNVISSDACSKCTIIIRLCTIPIYQTVEARGSTLPKCLVFYSILQALTLISNLQKQSCTVILRLTPTYLHTLQIL